MKNDKTIGELGLDRVIHERARLVILTFLASSQDIEVGFTELRDKLGFTAGNLSIQLKTLEEAGLLSIEKRFRDNKPFTGVKLSPAGERALGDYLQELEVIVSSLKRCRGKAAGAEIVDSRSEPVGARLNALEAVGAASAPEED